MAHLDQLEAAYAVDLLTRLSESIEMYLDDDRSGILETLESELEESRKLTRKYWRRVRAETARAQAAELADKWIKSVNKEIRDGRV